MNPNKRFVENTDGHVDCWSGLIPPKYVCLLRASRKRGCWRLSEFVLEKTIEVSDNSTGWGATSCWSLHISLKLDFDCNKTHAEFGWLCFSLFFPQISSLCLCFSSYLSALDHIYLSSSDSGWNHCARPPTSLRFPFLLSTSVTPCILSSGFCSHWPV